MAKTNAVYSNNARTTLAVSINDTVTSIQVVSAAGFPVLGSGIDYFTLTLDDGAFIEIVKVTSVVSNTLTVVRGQEGTTARSFVAPTTKAEHRLTADNIGRFARKEDRMEDYASIENLPDPSTVNPNSVMCASTDANGNPIIGTNNGTKWAFVNYPDRIRTNVVGAGATTTSLLWTSANLMLLDTAVRSYVIQFTSGTYRGNCRFITAVGGGSISWATPLGGVPGLADTYEVYSCVSAHRFPLGGGSDRVFMENDAQIWNDYTLPTGRNAASAGPVTITSGVTVTIPSGSVWTIL
jgi:hypothetical protein